MRRTSDSGPPAGELGLEPLLERTRLAVLNILVAVGLTIAVGGWTLHRRGEVPRPEPPRALRDGLTLTLIALAVSSFVLRRVLSRRATRLEPGLRESAFFRAHVLPAAIVALAAPLGIVQGWWLDPRLEAVIPFWVVPMALGFLYVPRAHELDDLPPTVPPNSGASSP